MPDTPDPPVTVSIGILTYQRPDGLRRTLTSAVDAVRHTVSTAWQVDEIIVIDNDRQPSAQFGVTEIADRAAGPPIRYHHESVPGLAAARNRALDEARGRVLVFIDDDETAADGWPGGLLATMAETGAALVGGPVRTTFVEPPAQWIVPLFERPEPPDGSVQTWLRSGNLAIDLDQIRPLGLRFDEAFATTGGEDVAFTAAARRHGLDLRWSASAVVTEQVGPERTSLAWVVGRERRSTANWVRVELGHRSTGRRRALVAARGLARIGQGAAMALGGGLTLRRATAARGLVLVGRGMGAFQGLLDRRIAAYAS